MSRVYLCGPITGLSYGEARNGWRKVVGEKIAPTIEVLSPMRQEGHLSEIQEIAHKPYEYNPLSSSRGIVSKDYLDVKRSDIVIANFLGAKAISVGSVMEIAWAWAMRKDVILVIEAEGNPHDRFFLTEQCPYRVETVEEAAAMANALLLPGV